MSICDKKRRLSWSIGDRKVGRERGSGYGVPVWFALFSCLYVVASFGFGVYIGGETGFKSTLANPQGNESVEVGNFTFHFTTNKTDSDMEGNLGYTYIGGDEVWINYNLVRNENWGVIRETCNHELLHVYGIPSRHHDKIDLYEGQIDDPVCRSLLEKLKG